MKCTLVFLLAFVSPALFASTLSGTFGTYRFPDDANAGTVMLTGDGSTRTVSAVWSVASTALGGTSPDVVLALSPASIPIGVTIAGSGPFLSPGNISAGSGTLTSSGVVTGSATLFYVYISSQWNGNNVSSSDASYYRYIGTLSFGPQSQTCALSNSTVPTVSGQTITGTASGAQVGNAYNISVVSGPASASINSSTGSYSVTATGSGSVSYKVWISAGGGFTASPDATATGTVGASFKYKYSIPANSSQLPVTYTLKQGGVVVGTLVSNPGDGAIIGVLDLGANGGVVTITSSVTGAALDGVNLVVSTGTVDLPKTQTVTPVATDTPTAVVIAPPAAVANSAQAPSASAAPVIWSAPTTTASSGDGLTNQVFREGIDKLVTPTQFMADMMATTKSAGDAAQAVGDSWITGPMVAILWASAQDKFDVIEGSHASDFSSLAVTSGSADGLVVSAAPLSLAPPIAVLGHTFVFEPYTYFPWLKSALGVIREVFLWGMGFIFYSMCQRKLEEIQFYLAIVPQVDTVDETAVIILGESGPGTNSAISLLKRVFVGGAIIGTIHIQLAACVVAMNTKLGELFGSGFTFDNILHITSTVSAHGGSFIGTAYSIVDNVFPIAASVEFVVIWLIFSWVCMVTFGVAAAAIKAIKI